MRYILREPTIEAIQYTGDNYKDVCKFVGYEPLSPINPEPPTMPIIIDTPYGITTACKGDYIVYDHSGKHFIRSPKLFEKSYKPLTEKETI